MPLAFVFPFCRRIVLLLLLLPGSLVALISAETLDRNAIEERLGSFRLGPAESVINQLPDPAYRAFYRSHLWVYQYLATQDSQYAQTFLTNWQETTDLIEKLPEQDPLRNILLAELYGKRAAIEFLDNNYLTAMRLARTCRRLVARNEEAFPGNVEQMKLLGLFNVVFAAVPKKYLWLTRFLGYTGDMQEGMGQLERAAEESSLLGMEAHLIAFYVEKNVLGKSAEAISRMEKRRKYSGDNILLDFLLATAYSGMNRNEDALSLLVRRDRYRKDDNVFFIPYWDYSLGKAYYYREDYNKAQQYLSLFLRTHTGNIYHSDATFRLGMAQTFSGQEAEAQKSFANMLSLEASPFDEDEYALHMAKKFSQKPPSAYLKLLFRARGLYDGGYYPKALAVLADLKRQQQSLSPEENTELYYRYGRVYHSLNQLGNAEANYRQCMAQPDSEQRWMQAYSCFYLGEIFRGQGKFETARDLYKQALTFDGYFYQGGLENRCKVALAELKGM